MNKDRRQAPRTHQEVMIEVAQLRYPMPKDPDLVGHLRNITDGGLCFVANRHYSPGTTLNLRIDLKGWRRHHTNVSSILDDGMTIAPLTAIAEVIWSQKQVEGAGVELGVRFVDIDQDEYQALVRYLKALTG